MSRQPTQQPSLNNLSTTLTSPGRCGRKWNENGKTYLDLSVFLPTMEICSLLVWMWISTGHFFLFSPHYFSFPCSCYFYLNPQFLVSSVVSRCLGQLPTVPGIHPPSPREMKSMLHLSSDPALTDGLLNSQIWIKIITALTHLYGFNLLEFSVEVHDIHVTEYNTREKRRDGIRYRLLR